MKNMTKVLVMSLCLGSLTACSTINGTKESSSTKPASTELTIDGSNAAAGSKFSKISLGMSGQQIYDLIGRETDRKSYVTGKAWIPFYYGSDTNRQELFYKGEGRLIFGGNRRLIKIIVDTKEDGYR